MLRNKDGEQVSGFSLPDGARSEGARLNGM